MKRPILLTLVTLFLVGGALAAWYGDLGRYVPMLSGAGKEATPGPGAGSGPGAGRPSGRPNAPVPVETTVVQGAVVSDEVEALGNLAANEMVAIAPEIAGRLTSLGFKEGDRVKKGQKLVALDTSILEQEVKQAQIDLALAKDTFQRANSLVERGSGTRVSLEQTQSQLSAGEVRVALAQARLEKASIAAPINGVVGLRAVSVGSYLTAGQTVVTLTDIDPIKVDFRVPELLLQSLEVGQKIRLRVDAIPDREFEGEVYAIDPIVDVNGRAIRLRARIPNADLALKPGLFARVTIVTSTRPNAVVVPESAIVPDGDAKAVYVVEDGKAKLTRVALGKRLPGRVEIAQGLAVGAVIVTTGQIRLRNGAAVEATQRPPQPQARVSTGVMR